MVGKVVKVKIGDLEEEVRAVFLRRTRKELTGAVQGILGKKRFLVRFQGGCKSEYVLKSTHHFDSIEDTRG